MNCVRFSSFSPPAPVLHPLKMPLVSGATRRAGKANHIPHTVPVSGEWGGDEAGPAVAAAAAAGPAAGPAVAAGPAAAAGPAGPAAAGPAAAAVAAKANPMDLLRDFVLAEKHAKKLEEEALAAIRAKKQQRASALKLKLGPVRTEKQLELKRLDTEIEVKLRNRERVLEELNRLDAALNPTPKPTTHPADLDPTPAQAAQAAKPNLAMQMLRNSVAAKPALTSVHKDPLWKVRQVPTGKPAHVHGPGDSKPKPETVRGGGGGGGGAKWTDGEREMKDALNAKKIHFGLCKTANDVIHLACAHVTKTPGYRGVLVTVDKLVPGFIAERNQLKCFLQRSLNCVNVVFSSDNTSVSFKPPSDLTKNFRGSKTRDDAIKRLCAYITLFYRFGGKRGALPLTVCEALGMTFHTGAWVMAVPGTDPMSPDYIEQLQDAGVISREQRKLLGKSLTKDHHDQLMKIFECDQENNTHDFKRIQEWCKEQGVQLKFLYRNNHTGEVVFVSCDYIGNTEVVLEAVLKRLAKSAAAAARRDACDEE